MMLMVTVPDGAASGQTIQISTPDGQMMMTTVPRGLSAGQQFEVSIAPATESMDRRGGDDELARIAAASVGVWKGTGFAEPCCRLDSSYRIHPLNAQNQYVLEGSWCVYCFGVCPIGHFSHTGTRDAAGLSFTDLSYNTGKMDGDPAQARSDLVFTLTSFDKDAKMATYNIGGMRNRSAVVSGTCTLDGKSMIETVERDGLLGRVKMTHKLQGGGGIA
jgi:hypothetical protein